MNFLKSLRIVLYSLLIITILFLLNQVVVPFGKISYKYNFCKKDNLITKLLPQDRVKPIKNCKQKIIGDPVYFNLKTFRKFKKIKLGIKYFSKNTPLIQIGSLIDGNLWQYDLRPVKCQLIDNLVRSNNWNLIKDGRTILLQREKKYKTINNFLNHLPNKNKIALLNYNLKKDFILPYYKSSRVKKVLNCKLQGRHQIFTYVANENLNWTFEFKKIDYNKKGNLIINLYYKDELIKSDKINNYANKFILFVKKPKSGFYKIDIKCNDNVIIKKITTQQHLFNFIGGIRFWKNNKLPINIYTNSQVVYGQTTNPNSLQRIKIESIGKKNDIIDFNINKTYKLFSQPTTATTTKLLIKKDDIIIKGDGIFAFSIKQLSNPLFQKISRFTKINNLDYILANYKIPEKLGNEEYAKVEFDLSKAYRENGKYGFMISIPGLRVNDKIDDWIKIDEINVELDK